jgi:hypothetical protein
MRMRNRTATLLVVLAVPTVAAVPGHALSPPPNETPDPAITDGSAQRAVDRARAAWAKAGIRTYRVRVALGCFCPEEVRKPRTLTVRRGSPVRPPAHLKAVATVPRMFRIVQGAIDDRVAGLTVTYGGRGVPRSIAIDVSRQIADEESFYTIDRFKRLG